MYDAQHTYGLDIETDNSTNHGLDPFRSTITEIAVATADGGEVFTGSERTILSDLDEYLRELPAGLIVTWNGLFFDVPFIATRAEEIRHNIGEAFHLIPQPGLKPKYDYLPGFTEAQTFTFERLGVGPQHSHLDISLAWKSFAESFGTKLVDGKTKPVVPWSLKPVAKAAGIEMFEIDRTRLHDYSDEDRNRYVLSDSSGTRELALRTLGLA